MCPFSPPPIYIDRPIVLHSGNRLRVDAKTEIRLLPYAGVCLVRNEHMVDGQHGQVEMCRGADRDIVVEGGIWRDLRSAWVPDDAHAATDKPLHGQHGLFTFHNVESIRICGATIREGSDFGIQIGNCRDVVVTDITFEEHHRDGVHDEGPAAGGIIRGLRGKTGDDVVALNAWDRESYSVTFGPISDVLVEDVASVPKWTWSELRLLAGTKRFANGERVPCDIERCVFRNIRNIHTVKMIDGLSIRDVRLDFAPGLENDRSVRLVAVGPMSTTWPLPAGDARGEWLEIFSPNVNCTVRDLAVSNVLGPLPDDTEPCIPVQDPARLVMVRKQHPNPDFPKTQPRGGTGRGELRHLVVDGKPGQPA